MLECNTQAVVASQHTKMLALIYFLPFKQQPIIIIMPTTTTTTTWRLFLHKENKMPSSCGQQSPTESRKDKHSAKKTIEQSGSNKSNRVAIVRPAEIRTDCTPGTCFQQQ